MVSSQKHETRLGDVSCLKFSAGLTSLATNGCGSKPTVPFGIGAQPILVGIGMFIGGTYGILVSVGLISLATNGFHLCKLARA